MAPSAAASAPPIRSAATADGSSRNGTGDDARLVVDGQEQARDQQERRRHGQAPAARHRDLVDAPRLGMIDDLVAEDDRSERRA